MKQLTQFFSRSLATSLAVLILIPASVLVISLSDVEARGRGVAVRGPRGGAAAAGRRAPPVQSVPGRVPAYRAPTARAAVRGTARRTARRTSRRMNALPSGHTTYVNGGVTYYVVDGLYYEAVYEGNNVIYIQVVLSD